MEPFKAGRPPDASLFPPCGVSVTYHPGLAAEVVYRVERVDSRKSSILKADDKAAVVLSQGHAVGMLSDQDEVWFEGPAKKGSNSYIKTWQYNQGLLYSHDPTWLLPIGTLS